MNQKKESPPESTTTDIRKEISRLTTNMKAQKTTTNLQAQKNKTTQCSNVALPLGLEPRTP